MTLRPIACLFAALFSFAAGVAEAEEPKPPAVTQAVPGMKRTVIQKTDLPGTEFELLVLRVEFDPNFEVKRHSHPGPEVSYVLEGEATYLLDGVAPETRGPGESITLPMDVIHGAKIGPKGVALLNSYVVLKGRPLVVPAK